MRCSVGYGELTYVASHQTTLLTPTGGYSTFQRHYNYWHRTLSFHWVVKTETVFKDLQNVSNRAYIYTVTSPRKRIHISS